MRQFCLSVFVILFSCSFLSAQKNTEWNAAKIKLQLEKLGNVGRVLYVAAHPDDENTALLAWLVNERKYRTAYLSLTRGDGGQNLVGDEQGAYLGLVRTQELLAARRIDGAEQFFSSALDFGFSKTAEETFDFWGHKRILGDVVWIIRKFRPNVIICRFPEDKRAGHGNHWASAVLAHEAFSAAADSTRFPEQLQYVAPWQAKRVLWNTYSFGGLNTTSPEQFKVNIGGYNVLLGKSYGEIAAQSRSMHKSQGFGESPSYGQNIAYFETIAGPAPRKSLMDGVNTTWSGIEGGKAVAPLIAEAIRQFDVDQPEKTVPQLLKIKKAVAALPDTTLRNRKEKAIDRLILACSGILLDAVSEQPYVVAGQKLQVNTKVINRSHVPVTLEEVDVTGYRKTTALKLKANQLQTASYEVTVPANTAISQPYWLEKEHPVGHYEIPDQRWVGLPETPPALNVSFTLNIAGVSLTVSEPIVYTYTDPVRGAVVDPLVVAPPVTANVAEEVYVFTTPEPRRIQVNLASYKDSVKGTAHLEVPDNFSVKNNDQSFFVKQAGSKATLSFIVAPNGPIRSSASEPLTVHLHVNGKDYNRGIRVIRYNYIPTITVFPFSTAKLVAMPLKKTGDKIGYIMGAGDKIPEALTQIGYQVRLLNDQELAAIDLTQFDAIITGVRAYNTRKNLRYVQDRLMQYVKEGGTLLIQYNKNRNVVVKDLGPYPFKITRNRVTDETAKVDFLLPDDPVLNYPNKITEADFKNWIQERGLYFVDGRDPHYRSPIAMHDPGEPVLDGSLIVCDYGKGKFVYTSLSFFRELPAGVPGAYRLFVNLIAKRNPHSPGKSN